MKRRTKSKKKKIPGDFVSGHVRSMASGKPVKVRGYRRKLKAGKIRRKLRQYKSKYVYVDSGTGRFVNKR